MRALCARLQQRVVCVRLFQAVEAEPDGRGLLRRILIGLSQEGGRAQGGASDNNTRRGGRGYLLLRRRRPSHGPPSTPALLAAAAAAAPWSVASLAPTPAEPLSRSAL